MSTPAYSGSVAIVIRSYPHRAFKIRGDTPLLGAGERLCYAKIPSAVLNAMQHCYPPVGAPSVGFLNVADSKGIRAG